MSEFCQTPAAFPPYSPGAATALQGRREQSWDRKGIKQDQLVADLETAPHGHHQVAVEAGREEPGFAFLTGLVDGKRRLGRDAVFNDARQADHVAVGVDIVL